MNDSVLSRRELIGVCLTFPNSYEDYPFDDDNWTVIRHRSNKKIFAWIYERNGKLHINLKCEPMKADFWRNVYTSVTPGFHMNKVHWNTITIGGDVPHDELVSMIADSHSLTKGK
jgi:Uncharacterized protein conserved in bacteria